ncbi:hypothetical protein SAICODRAFT_22669 [Saitoella complicata NRRL Y-17804]|uniref:uncharacterized protein n=1 Tax=Saitoella complicata (strain BCRC 22490 / CBS 7301 / JCM 7358 / NBRC 10748 / NRRL Y-17804) TaxID=698492 RepID=UPI000867D88E|nr:uncharacterized protein SAICODRAFT_22669 [Saitoella complicata NRRL Y-17804]ODQ56284.1 hypothetical protein SAICODRAFT_22669 [Saitoella complicata NRRL Y-17804]
MSLLGTYIISETVRATLSHAVSSASGTHLSPAHFTLASEVLKLCVASAVSRSGTHKSHTNHTNGLWRGYWVYAVPAALYYANNLMYLWGMRVSAPSVLHVSMLAKLPVTGVLHHVLVRRENRPGVWGALLTICAGLYLFNSAPGAGAGASSEGGAGGFANGAMLGTAIAVVSATTGIYTELVITHDAVPFWTAQVLLYAFSSAIALCTVLTTSASLLPSVSGLDGVLVLVTVLTGLIVAEILRQRDTLVKLVGTAATVLTIALVQCILFPELRPSTFTQRGILGAGVVAIGIWVWNAWKVEGQEVDDHDDERGKEGRHIPGKPVKQGSGQPTAKKLAVAATAVLVLSAFAPSDPARSYRASPSTYDRDMETYFRPRGLVPSAWGTDPAPYTCVHDLVTRYDLNADSVPKALAHPSQACPLYPIPDGGLIFHAYWAGPWRPFHEVMIDSFLATQRLGDGHKMVYWYVGPGPSENTRLKYAGGVGKGYVEFREFAAENEATGTCLEQMSEWRDVKYREEVKMPVESYSDLVRTLLLAKYGGVWVDSDTLLLHDLTPLIRTGANAPRLGLNKWNNNLLVYGPPDAGIGQKVLEVSCSLSFNESNWQYSDSLKPERWYWLYNDGALRVCLEHENCGISGHPAFLQGGTRTVEPCEKGLDPRRSAFPYSLRGLWTWHARLNSRDDECIRPEAQNAVMSLVRRIEDMLKDGIDHQGRSIIRGYE